MRRLVFALLLVAPAACKRTGPATAHALNPAVTTATVARTDRLTVEMMVDLREVSDVAVTPDGRRIAYVVRVPPKPDDGPAGMHSQIWVVPTRGGEPRRFTAEDVSSWSPQWSPDGRTLAFLSARKGTPGRQVWGIPADGGEPVALTKSSADIERFEWSPDGKHIAYSAEREATKKERADEEAGRDWITSDVHGTWSQLFVAPISGGSAKAITPRERDVIAFRWAPDGEQLAVRAADRSDIDGEMMYSRLYTIAAEGGALKELAETEGKLGAFEWSPDGKQIAFLGAEDIHDPTAGVLWVVPATGGAARALTRDYLGTGEDLRWLGKDAIAMLAHQGTKTPIVRVSVKDGDAGALLSGPTICRGFDIADDTRTVACAGELPTHPRELFAGDLRRGGLKRLTRLNPHVDQVVLGERRVMKWKADDGLEIEGVVTLPVGYEKGKRYPLAILPHGGPEGISLDGWNTRAGYPVQMFATHGYVVLEPNYRGSGGRGVDYGKADHLDLGGKEFQDVLAGIDFLAAEGLVDPARVGMGGWSYGGYFSGLAATMHSSRFKAAVVAAAITDWISFTGTSEIEHENSLVHWKMWPWDDFPRTWERSPVAHVGSSKTPTLIVHGTSDTRVPPEQATELYRALKHKKVPTEIVYYPREGHGLRERAHQIDFATRFLAWFDTHV